MAAAICRVWWISPRTLGRSMGGPWRSNWARTGYCITWCSRRGKSPAFGTRVAAGRISRRLPPPRPRPPTAIRRSRSASPAPAPPTRKAGALTYLWEFGDGATATAPNPFHTYTAAGVTTFPVLLTVTDTLGAKSTASLNVVVGSTPPVATIDLPATGAHLTVGQTATYHGSATDPDDGPLPSSALHWTVLLHHNTHIHPFIDTTGSGGSFSVDNHDPSGTFSYEFRLTATDSSGLTNTKSITVPVNPPPPSAPVLLYGMNEGSGTTLTDTSGNGHTGHAGQRAGVGGGPGDLWPGPRLRWRRRCRLRRQSGGLQLRHGRFYD